MNNNMICLVFHKETIHDRALCFKSDLICSVTGSFERIRKMTIKSLHCEFLFAQDSGFIFFNPVIYADTTTSQQRSSQSIPVPHRQTLTTIPI